MNKEKLQTDLNNYISNMIRHEGNVLELKKQVQQTQAELDYEQDQMAICHTEITKLKQLLSEQSN